MDAYRGKIYRKIEKIDEDLFKVFSLKNGAGIINKRGEVVFDFIYDYIENFNGDLANAKKGGKWGCIKKNGSVAVNFEYDEIRDWSHGMAVAKKNKAIGVINSNGETIIDFKFEDLKINGEEETFSVKLYNKWGIINKNENIIFEIIYDRVLYSEGFIIAKLEESCFIFNQKGMLISPRKITKNKIIIEEKEYNYAIHGNKFYVYFPKVNLVGDVETCLFGFEDIYHKELVSKDYDFEDAIAIAEFLNIDLS